MTQSKIDRISEVLGGKVTEAKIRGWLHHKRAFGDLLFLIVRDGTGVIQCAVKRETVGQSLFEEMQQLPRESVVVVGGNRKEDKRVPGGFEIAATKIEIVKKSEETFPIDPRKKGWLRT